MEKNKELIWGLLSLLLFLALVYSGQFALSRGDNLYNSPRLGDVVVRIVKAEIESYLLNSEAFAGLSPNNQGNWEANCVLYYQGKAVGNSQNKGRDLVSAIQNAARATAEIIKAGNFKKENLQDATVVLNIISPSGGKKAFIEYQGAGREFLGGIIPLRNFTGESIKQKVTEGKNFLLRMADPAEYGFHKFYYAVEDKTENILHTVYSASAIYTMLNIYEKEKDSKIISELPKWADFILSMQNTAPGDARYGAFYYSLDLKSGVKEKKFVSGTASISIFTLLKLYEFNGEQKYLQAAIDAGDWLLGRMQKSDGSIIDYERYDEAKGKWVRGTKESTLFDGQALSAFARLYKITKQEKYIKAAQKTAELFVEKYKKDGDFFGDDYRQKNPISSAWVTMSLTDFCRAKPDCGYEKIIFGLSDKIISVQENNPDDILYYGTWAGVYSTSGAGWLAEVMTEEYKFCQQQSVFSKDKPENILINLAEYMVLSKNLNCLKYKISAEKAIRWVAQNTYSLENSFFLKNPEKARGGAFWNIDNRYVRIDSVCHAINAYLGIAY